MVRQFKLFSRDPNILPIEVRTTVAVTFVSISLLSIYWHDIGVSRSLAVFRIVLAGFGTLVMYWATRAKEQDLQRILKQITPIGGTKLSFKEIIQVIAVHYVAIVMFFLYYAQALSTARYHPDHLKLPLVLCVGILFLFFASVITGQYGVIKLTRRWCSRWSKRIQASQDQNGEIRDFLKLIGVTSLILSLLCGLITIP
jgi:hypothetical protein